MPKVKKVIGKPFRAVQLTIYITPKVSGNAQVNTQLKHRCVDKQHAVDLISQYVKLNTRIKESEKN